MLPNGCCSVKSALNQVRHNADIFQELFLEDAIGIPEDFFPNGNGNFSYLAENDADENTFFMSGNCLLIGNINS